jgi:hypothetical protein
MSLVNGKRLTAINVAEDPQAYTCLAREAV